MLIAQMSDMHVKRRGTRLFGHVDTAGRLEACVTHLNTLPLRPDAVLVTGDMTNDGEVSDYETLVPLLDGLEMPYYPVPGNHDDRDRMRVAFRHLGLLPADGPLCYAVERRPVRLVALDTLVSGQPHGQLGRTQLAWLDTTLGAAPDQPAVVFLHHPPFATGIGHMDAMGLADAEALRDVIARHPQVERVLCGHIHRPIQVRWAGTLVLTAPGTAHQVALGLAPDSPSRWIAEPPAVLLHLWRDDAGLVTHLSYVGDYGAPMRFSDAHRRPPAE